MMAKKITCKIVSSVPIGQINAGVLSVRHPNNYQHETDDMTAACFNLKHNRNISHSFSPGTMNAFPIGQILDYCA
jgi:hypothetical protein